METSRRSNPLNREKGQGSHPGIDPRHEDNTYQQGEVLLSSPAIPAKKGLSNQDLEALFRWEDEGGRII